MNRKLNLEVKVRGERRTATVFMCVCSSRKCVTKSLITFVCDETCVFSRQYRVRVYVQTQA